MTPSSDVKDPQNHLWMTPSESCCFSKPFRMSYFPIRQTIFPPLVGMSETLGIIYFRDCQVGRALRRRTRQHISPIQFLGNVSRQKQIHAKKKPAIKNI